VTPSLTSKQIRAALAVHLRYERQCIIFAFERGLCAGSPDVFGVLPDRHFIEFEVKISVGDFRRDAKKDKWTMPTSIWSKRPRLFYYAVPPEIVDKVTPLLPKGAGLVTLGGWDPISKLPVVIFKKKPVADKAAIKATDSDIWAMAKHLSGTACNILTQHYAETYLRPEPT